MEELSYLHTPTNYQYHYHTIPERLALQVHLRGEKEVYVFLDRDGKRVGTTTRELFKKSNQLAKAFLQLGIQKGDIIALCLPNDFEGLVCLFGVIQAGAIVLNVISAREDGSDVKTVLSKTGAKALIINPGEKNAVFNACMNFLDGFEADGTVNCKDVPVLKYFITSTAVGNHETFTLQELLNVEVDSILPKLNADDIAILLPTSGSTGEPKFVPLSHFTAMVVGNQLHESIKYSPDDVIYSERRFAWIGGFPFMLLHNGVKVVTKTSAIPTIDEHCKFTLETLIKEDCTHACLLPATIIGVNELVCERQSPLLRGIQTGALPVAAVCYSSLGKLSERITNCYGSSEAGFVTSHHVTCVEGNLEYNAGPPLQGVEIKVVDSQGDIVKRGETGAIYVRSPSLFTGYFANKQKTDEVLSPCRWFNTDDTGLIDSSGNLIVTGRQSDIILQAGKIYVPYLVEGIIKKHPDVLDAIVVPVPDEVLFQLVCACVIAKPGTNLTSDDLSTFYKSQFLASANEAFGGFIPRMFLLFDQYPRLFTGKPDKKQLIKEAIKRRALDKQKC